MKKIAKLISAAVLSFSLMAGVASAADCEISNTGPGSVNTCEFNEDKEVTITCKNNVKVTNDSDQTAVSGEVVVVGNTTAYNGESGDASNINTVVNELALSCGTVAAAPEKPVVRPGGGTGGGVVKPNKAVEADDKDDKEVAQVASAPQGGVGAGAGGSSDSGLSTIVGLIASIGALASGAFLFKKFEL